VWSTPGPAGGPLSAPLRAKLCRHVLRIERHWWVQMRYYADPSDLDEALSVLRSVEWISHHRTALWS
jgi:hypothetical protein